MLCYLWVLQQISPNVFQVQQQLQHLELALQQQQLQKKLQHQMNLYLGNFIISHSDLKLYM